MRSYVGTKIINAELVKMSEYKVRKYGGEAKINEGDEKVIGYLVIYPPIGDNGEPYMSWSPQSVFEKAYRPIEACEKSLIIDRDMNKK